MTVKIYQINQNTDYEFMDYNFAKAHGFSRDDYELIYQTERDDDYTPDDCFEEFNMARPEDFEGHSLSVSDIIELGDKTYYCESVGWQQL